MTKLHHEIQINAPVSKVWHILANLEEVAKRQSVNSWSFGYVYLKLYHALFY